MVLKFCVYRQKKTQHYINAYGILECSNCEPILSESEEESSDDESYDSDFKDDTD